MHKALDTKNHDFLLALTGGDFFVFICKKNLTGGEF